MVDIHCHIIPGVDDGAKDWETAVAMCNMAIKDGIRHIVATPHANPEYTYDREQHQEKLNKLRELTGGKLEFSLGCDFHMSYENIRDVMKNPSNFCIGETPYLLVEFNDFSIPPNTTDVLDQFINKNIIPIITHPERNPLLQKKPDMVVEWAEHGAVVQVTANSLTGRWGPIARKTIEYLLRKNAVHVLASDAHGLNSRPPILSEAREEMARLAGRRVADAMVNDNPRSIVSCESLTYQNGEFLD